MVTMLAGVRNIILCWRLLWDPRVSGFAKLVPIAAVLYAASPVDVLMDWSLPGIGVLDDAAVVLVAMRLFPRLAPRHVVADHLYWMAHPTKRPKARKEEPACPKRIS